MFLSPHVTVQSERRFTRCVSTAPPEARESGARLVWNPIGCQDQKLELWSLTVPESVCSLGPEMQDLLVQLELPTLFVECLDDQCCTISFVLFR